MSATGDEQPFVDADVRTGLTDWLGRILERATPDSWVAGGGTDDELTFERRPRNYEELKQREAIYLNGGPITTFIDTRAMMMHGIGAEFQTDSPVTDDAGRSPADVLNDLIPNLSVHLAEAATQTYWAGDAWPEIVETRTGEFSHLGLVDPTTVDVQWDDHGKIAGLQQIIVDGNNRAKSQALDDDLVGHYFNSRAPGGPLGVSLIERNFDEIETYAKNAAQRANAIRLHASPHYDVSVGSEGQSIPDKLMRRVMRRFRSDQINEETNWVHGGDIEIGMLDVPGFEGMSGIVETDIALLAMVFDVPLEWTNFGSAGLGDGTPADSRLRAFEVKARAEQAMRAEQVVDLAKAILERYTQFPRDVDLQLVYDDISNDQAETAEWMRDFKSYLTPNEIRERLDLPAVDDTGELGPPEGTPDAEAGGGMGGGLFADVAEDGVLVGRRDAERLGDVDAPDPLAGDAAAKRAHTDGGAVVGGRDMGNRSLLLDSRTADELTQEELVWADVYDRVLWSDDAGRALFEFDPEEVPKFVMERLREAVASGALFEGFETVSSAAADEIGEALLDSLDDSHGWSITSLRDNLREVAPELTVDEAERIARTETQALVADAREQGYREEFDVDEERFKWVGPDDHRNSDVCPDIKAEQPDEGLSLEELKELVQDTARGLGHDPREWTPHVNCRHTYTRVV